jgi:hypothetical protein
MELESIMTNYCGATGSCQQCKGSCRCGCKHKLCLVVGELNKVSIPCPKDDCGCRAEVLSSELIVKCPCGCPCLIDIKATAHSDRCKCWLDVDLREYESIKWMNCSSCKFHYTLKINGSSHLSGDICLDWTFI